MFILATMVVYGEQIDAERLVTLGLFGSPLSYLL